MDSTVQSTNLQKLYAYLELAELSEGEERKKWLDEAVSLTNDSFIATQTKIEIIKKLATLDPNIFKTEGPVKEDSGDPSILVTFGNYFLQLNKPQEAVDYYYGAIVAYGNLKSESDIESYIDTQRIIIPKVQATADFTRLLISQIATKVNGNENIRALLNQLLTKIEDGNLDDSIKNVVRDNFWYNHGKPFPQYEKSK